MPDEERTQKADLGALAELLTLKLEHTDRRIDSVSERQKTDSSRQEKRADEMSEAIRRLAEVVSAQKEVTGPLVSQVARLRLEVDGIRKYESGWKQSSDTATAVEKVVWGVIQTAVTAGVAGAVAYFLA